MILKQFKIIVYVSSFRNLRDLKRYGLVVYSSKSYHYVVMYIEQDQYKEVAQAIHKLPSITKIEPSPLNQLVTTFSQANDVDEDDDDEV